MTTPNIAACSQQQQQQPTTTNLIPFKKTQVVKRGGVCKLQVGQVPIEELSVFPAQVHVARLVVFFLFDLAIDLLQLVHLLVEALIYAAGGSTGREGDVILLLIEYCNSGFRSDQEDIGWKKLTIYFK